MPLYVDTNSPIPIYYQIREQLRKQILSGQLEPGNPLPTEMQICAECGVSRMTARAALTQLANEGLVTRQRGRGTFVAQPKSTFRDDTSFLLSYTQIMSRLGLQAGAHIQGQHLLPADPEIAQTLQIAKGDTVVRIDRLRLGNNEPMSIEISFLPSQLFPGLETIDLTNRSLYQVLEQNFGIVPNHAIDTTELSSAGAYEATILDVKEGTPVVLNTRLTFSIQNTPLIFTQTTHRGDRFRSEVRCTRQQIMDI